MWTTYEPGVRHAAAAAGNQIEADSTAESSHGLSRRKASGLGFRGDFKGTPKAEVFSVASLLKGSLVFFSGLLCKG